MVLIIIRCTLMYTLYMTRSPARCVEGKKAEHRAAVTRVDEVVHAAVTRSRKAMTEGTSSNNL